MRLDPDDLQRFINAQLRNSVFTISKLVDGLPPPYGQALVEGLVDQIRDQARNLKEELPDAIHNLGVHASKAWDRDDLELSLFEAGHEAHPDNLDLMADLLQLYYGQHHNPKRAAEVWNRMSDLPPERRMPYWRYWVFGALYHALLKHDMETAQQLMRDGIEHTNGADKVHVLTNLTNVFVGRSSSPDSHEVMRVLRHWIGKGVPHGCAIATEMAVLLRRHVQAPVDGDGTSVQASTDNSPSRDARRARLSEALEWLTIAEELYSEGPRQSLTDIYRERVHVLMALREYREATEYAAAIFAAGERAPDPSLDAQLRLACSRIGEAHTWRAIREEQAHDRAPSAGAPPSEVEPDE